MREQIKGLLKRSYLDGAALELLQAASRISWHFSRQFGRVDRAIVADYVRAHAVRKLHIGCGDHLLDGWLNADIFPRSSSIPHLDATARFPIGDAEFDYVFSEHMIEHISYSQGLRMLSECYRVLRVNGTIRISTPNLAFLIDLYRDEKSDLQKAYIEWATAHHIRYAPRSDDAFVINTFMRDWGHQFIYDDKTLRESFEKAGFTRIVRCELNRSEHEAFRNLENEARMPAGCLRLETITLEGTKSSATQAG